jgi:hypothetical protein
MLLSHTMKLREVITSADIRAFLNFPPELYRNDPEYIRPLDKDIEQVFDKSKNKFFRHGEAIRWLLTNDENKIIGRVAAFINRKTASKEVIPTGGMGFFECINDRETAFFLFDSCKKWLQERGMEAMDGPINFGERDRWWGLLVDGFYEPIYCMNYNLPYYRELFEAYGFRTYYNQYCFSLRVSDPVDPKFEETYHRLKKAGNYHVETISKKNIEKYAADFTTIYNKAWVTHGGGKTITNEQTLNLFKKMKPVLVEYLVYFAYYKNEPVGAWLNLPELNQYFKYLDGKFDLFHKLKFLWIKLTKKNRKFYGIVFGVIPEHQGKGVDGLMIWSGAINIRKKNEFRDMEIQWIGDFNPKMLSIARSLGTKQCRTLITYRKLFDETKPFERYKIME